jgi:hypothetical protein
MKSLSHFENFARSARYADLCLVLEPLVVSRDSLINTQPPCSIREPPHQTTPSLPTQPRPASATCNSHRPTASAASASGFLLTALSNARTNTCFLRILHLARVR